MSDEDPARCFNPSGTHTHIDRKGSTLDMDIYSTRLLGRRTRIGSPLGVDAATNPTRSASSTWRYSPQCRGVAGGSHYAASHALRRVPILEARSRELGGPLALLDAAHRASRSLREAPPLGHGSGRICRPCRPPYTRLPRSPFFVSADMERHLLAREDVLPSFGHGVRAQQRRRSDEAVRRACMRESLAARHLPTTG